MSDNMDEQGTPTNEASEVLLNAAGDDPAKKARIAEALSRFKARKPTELTVSGSEGVDEEKKFTGSGKDVDWSEYNLNYSVRHLYPEAQLEETPDGPKWIAMVDEFYSTEREYRSYSTRVAARDGKGDEPLNLGLFLNDMLNSSDGWRLVSLLPGNTGRAGLLLQRKMRVVLPDPIPLQKGTEVEPPTDPELTDLDDAASDFAASMGLTSPPSAGDDRNVPPLNNLIEQALAINPPTLRDPGPLAGRKAGEPSDLAMQAGREVADQIMKTEE